MQDDVLKLSDFIRTEMIFLDESLADKNAVLRFIADKCRECRLVTDADLLYQGLRSREESMSTGIGGGLAFPHATTPERDEAAVAILILSDPIPFDAIDEQDVDIVFAIIIPEEDQTQHLQILARVSRLCRNTEFTTIVRQAKDPETLKQDIARIETDIMDYFYNS